ncbi:hypothetical protein B566_EDAN015721 [Ephemera danica]|nr:hypothetical protein B566_EDAN015721 [Ephemera danica]
MVIGHKWWRFMGVLHDSELEQGEAMEEENSAAGAGPVARPRAAVVRVRIKVEPPDIRDIDDDSPEDWATPRLVIDLVRSQHYAGGMASQRVEISLPGLESSKIPRPPNAFMVFANEWRRKLAFQHPSENNKEISVRLGVMWKSLSAEAKEGYYAASREADIEHKRKYPGYYYSPKEARLRKRLKQKGSNKADLQALQLVRVLMEDQSQAKTT